MNGLANRIRERSMFWSADDAITAPNPVVVVAVLSPGAASTDNNAKLVGYFRVPSSSP